MFDVLLLGGVVVVAPNSALCVLISSLWHGENHGNLKWELFSAEICAMTLRLVGLAGWRWCEHIYNNGVR